MKIEYKEITTGEGDKAISFHIETNKGKAIGLFVDNNIYVHLIEGNGCVKGIMNILINKFNTNKVVFTPLINDNVKNSIKGDIKVMKSNDPRNPYGEDFEYMECEWGVKNGKI